MRWGRRPLIARDDEFDVIETVAAIADELETTSAAVALAWLAARSQTVGPLVGARRLEHLEANLAGLDVNLTPEHLRVLDEVSMPRLSYPAEMNGETRAMLQFAGALQRCPVLTVRTAGEAKESRAEVAVGVPAATAPLAVAAAGAVAAREEWQVSPATRQPGR
ncbi:MAG: hypothetical protein QOC90_2099 [Mycobacterium sp.]|nr:hypothetical protein [Mycobacterium sp.]